jgi:type IV pilus assembly protein PilN
MIRINLLPVKRRKKAQPLPPVVIHSILILFVTVLVLVFFTFHLSGKISTKKKIMADKQVRLAELEEQLKEVANFERDNEIFQKKKKIIEQLKRKQVVPLRLLNEVSALIPEGVWLVDLIDAGGTVTISGYTFSNTELVTYVQSLKSSEYLVDVALLESRQQKMGDILIYRFRLTLRVKI